MSQEIQETPLVTLHEELGGKLVEFAGWRMPVQYSSIMDEHGAVRSAAGIFDISHMGQFFLSGEGAEEWLNTMLTNDVASLAIGEAQYTFLLNREGGVIDDLIIYRLAEGEIFMVVNAAKIEEDFAWLSAQLAEGLSLVDASADWAGMAVQGPEAVAKFAELFAGRELPERNGVDAWQEGEVEYLVCRTGYTGEDGYEIFCSATHGAALFKRFVDAGVKPCGLGARDSLRLEVCYPLNGNDLSPERTPLQAGLGFACKLDKGVDFVGIEELRRQKKEGLGERLVAIQYTGKGAPPRAGYAVHLPDGDEVATLTSGVSSPSLKIGIGMAYLPVDLAKVGTELEVVVRGRRFPAKVVKKPFYKKD